ncbi:hypothetical protein PR202_ga26329 [Eleusine coracana subsp. coracana]|uniref:Uncharacterized protein n=1 Tax=Eleusine coracana subsp. coracana TaxID=191504 RepID=A0AAV5DDG0_ELECO|nr:hypothetical protein PR202_ga26329 [Eleusine coracana subsp. coracana]
MARVFHRRLLIDAVAVAVVASLLRPAVADSSAAHPSAPSTDSTGTDPVVDTDDWDDFADDFPTADLLLSPSSWVPLLDPTSPSASDDGLVSTDDTLFVKGARAMLSAASAGNYLAFSMAANQIEAAAEEGHPGALSVLAFFSGAGMTRPASRSRAWLLHKLAADAGDLQSKMALAYSYFRQEMYEQAVTLYAESAKAAVSALISKMPPIKIIERFKIHSGTEENKEALMKSRGEDDDDFQIT